MTPSKMLSLAEKKMAAEGPFKLKKKPAAAKAVTKTIKATVKAPAKTIRRAVGAGRS
jgi:hypothetical protein